MLNSMFMLRYNTFYYKICLGCPKHCMIRWNLFRLHRVQSLNITYLKIQRVKYLSYILIIFYSRWHYLKSSHYYVFLFYMDRSQGFVALCIWITYFLKAFTLNISGKIIHNWLHLLVLWLQDKIVYASFH